MSQFKNSPRQKRIRLERDLYRIPEQVVSITISCRYRRRVFETESFTNVCREALRASAERRSIAVLVYCFMPDHVHLLLQPRTDTDIIEFVQRFKSWTTRQAWEHGIKGKIWQPRFYDHIIREGDDPIRHMRYIVENPVRANLVDTWYEYPFLGSFVYDLESVDW